MSITKISPSVVDFDDGITITVDDNSDTLTLSSTDADAASGPILNFYRNSASAADADLLGKIDFTGKNDAGSPEDVTYIRMFGKIIDASDGTEDGQLHINTMVGGSITQRVTMSPTELIINDASADLDFRVESDDHSHMLFVDAGNNAVGIKNDSPHDASWAADGANTAQLSIGNTSSGSTYGILHLLGHNTQATRYSIGAGDGIMYLAYDDVNAAHRIKVHADGDVEIVDGNINMASGHGIDFAAHTHTSASGASMSSELLDSYEEGTWTPILEGDSGQTTASTAVGWYVKVGNTMHVGGTYVWSSNGTNANTNTRITGLPLACNSTASFRNTGAIGVSNGLPDGEKQRLVIDPGNSHIWIITQTDKTYSLSHSMEASGALYGFSVTYRTA